jgi:hypothetical protein
MSSCVPEIHSQYSHQVKYDIVAWEEIFSFTESMTVFNISILFLMRAVLSRYGFVPLRGFIIFFKYCLLCAFAPLILPLWLLRLALGLIEKCRKAAGIKEKKRRSDSRCALKAVKQLQGPK